MDKMKRRTSKKLRKRLARKQKKSKNPMVKHSVNKRTGKVQVSESRVFISWTRAILYVIDISPNKNIGMVLWCEHMRSGSTGLRKSQVYPIGYGRKIASLHQRDLVLSSVSLLFFGTDFRNPTEHQSWYKSTWKWSWIRSSHAQSSSARFEAKNPGLLRILLYNNADLMDAAQAGTTAYKAIALW